MPDGTIKDVSSLVARLLILKGGRELKIKPININIVYERTGRTGNSEISGTGTNGKRRGRKRKIPTGLD